MKRNDHLFQFTGSEIAAAARAEYSYHTTRADWWNEEFKKALEKARAAGLEVREYEVSGGGRRADVIIDPSVSGRLNECSGKVASHRKASEQFNIEAGCYATQPNRTYELDPSDVVYFRLSGGPRED